MNERSFRLFDFRLNSFVSFFDRKIEQTFELKNENNVEFDRSLRQFYCHRLLWLVHPTYSNRTRRVTTPKTNSKPEKNDKKTVFSFSSKRTTRFPMTKVKRKNGIQGQPAHSKQTHIDSIHSPQRTRKTILKKKEKLIERLLTKRLFLFFYINA